MTSRETRYADKIRALLNKAESTTPEEAELCVAKAQELMTKYAISQVLLDEAEGRSVDDIEQREVELAGLFHEVRMDLTSAVARANNCRPVYRKIESWSSRRLTVNGKEYKVGTILTLTGFRSDLERATLLDASLQIQLSRALHAWHRENKKSWWTGGQDHQERRQFIRGFTWAVTDKLQKANKRGESEAAREEATRSHVTEEAATECVALVLRSRKDRVDDWFDEKYGSTLRSVSRNYRSGSRSATDAGQDAGSRADIGQSRIGGRGALSRGRAA